MAVSFYVILVGLWLKKLWGNLGLLGKWLGSRRQVLKFQGITWLWLVFSHALNDHLVRHIHYILTTRTDASMLHEKKKSQPDGLGALPIFS